MTPEIDAQPDGNVSARTNTPALTKKDPRGGSHCRRNSERSASPCFFRGRPSRVSRLGPSAPVGTRGARNFHHLAARLKKPSTGRCREPGHWTTEKATTNGTQHEADMSRSLRPRGDAMRGSARRSAEARISDAHLNYIRISRLKLRRTTDRSETQIDDTRRRKTRGNATCRRGVSRRALLIKWRSRI